MKILKTLSSKNISENFQKISQKIKNIFYRFPVPVSFALLGTILSLYGVEFEPREEFIPKLIFVSSLAIFLFTSLTLFAEKFKNPNRSVLIGLGFIFIMLYYYTLPEKFFSQFESIILSRHIFLIAASLVGLFWTTFTLKPVENKTLWEWSRQLLSNFIITTFFSVVICLGLIAAVFAISTLFDIKSEGKIYFEIWITVVGVFAPFFFLSNLPEKSENLKIPKEIPAFISILTKYILTPLAIGYFLILYTYTFKVLLTFDLPKNLLGWLVIGFSNVAIITYFLWTPFWTEKLKKYKQYLWLVLLPQIAMLFLAMGIRINEYSWTENRYFVVILGLWLLGISLYFLICKKAKFKYFFASLMLVIIFTQYGPLSGYNIGKTSQQKRLTQILTENKLLDENNKIIPLKNEENVELKTLFEIGDITKYLVNRHGKKSIEKVIPGILKKIQKSKNKRLEGNFNYDPINYKLGNYEIPGLITQAFGFDFVYEWELKTKEEAKNLLKEDYVNFQIKYNQPRNISGYDLFIPVLHYYDRRPKLIKDKKEISENNITATSHKEKNIIFIKKNNKLLAEIKTSEFFQKLLEARSQEIRKKLKEAKSKKDSKNKKPIRQQDKIRFALGKSENEMTPEKLAYIFENENLKAKIFFNSLWGHAGKIDSFDAHLYLKLKNNASDETSEALEPNILEEKIDNKLLGV